MAKKLVKKVNLHKALATGTTLAEFKKANPTKKKSK